MYAQETLNTSIANGLPVQFLGPCPKDDNAYECRFSFLPGMNLSGSKISGFSKYSGFLFIAQSGNNISVPFGIVKLYFSHSQDFVQTRSAL